MGSILLSRILGFVREWMVAHQVGSNAQTDAFYSAFTLPDFLNYLVAGAFAQHHLHTRLRQSTPRKGARTKAGACFPRW